MRELTDKQKKFARKEFSADSAKLEHKDPALRLRKFYVTALKGNGYAEKASAFSGHKPSTSDEPRMDTNNC